MVTRAGFKPDKLLLVGGFGSSLYLRSRLESTFGTRMGDLLAPPFGYSAVVEGAVRYLQRPKTIVSRISTLTYGVQVGRCISSVKSAMHPVPNLRETNCGSGSCTFEAGICCRDRQ